ncbi:MAG: carbon storage regulator CsrA [Bacteroidales bacterium]
MGKCKMLVLNRRVGEKLIIGGNIEVTILAIKGGQIRVGIEAPKEISVIREEIKDKYPQS